LGWGCKDRDSSTALASSTGSCHFTPTQTFLGTSAARFSTSGVPGT
jgi:hypothetical protein